MPEPKPVAALNESEAAAELTQLADEIAAHDIRYYQEEAPSVSDADYDALKQRNAAIEARFPHLVRENSPSLRVGAARAAAFAPVEHGVPMQRMRRADRHRPRSGFLQERAQVGEGTHAMPLGKRRRPLSVPITDGNEFGFRQRPQSAFLLGNSENFNPQPNLLAGSAARLFLGTQLRCAECHNHPFAPWTQADFWGTAAFFSQFQITGFKVRQPPSLVDRPGSGAAIVVPASAGRLAGNWRQNSARAASCHRRGLPVLDRPLRRSRWRRISGVSNQVLRGLREHGLEGFGRQRRLPGRIACKGTKSTVRIAGLCL